MASSGGVPPVSALVLLTDLAQPAVMAAAKQGLQAFGSALCLQAGACGAVSAAAVPAVLQAAATRLLLGLCSLTYAPGNSKPVLSVRYRPGIFALRDFHAAVSRLVASGGEGTASAGSGATAAAALQQLVGVVAQDAACAAAGPNKTVLLLTDRLEYDPQDFYAALEVCRSKGVRVELVLLDAAVDGAPACTQVVAEAWGAAEAAFPHLAVTVVQASRLAFSALASALLQRYAPQPQLAVSLQFKQPLVGSIRSLGLICSSELRPLHQAVSHAALCPCHGQPASWIGSGGTAALCSVTGAYLDGRRCGRDERVVVVGGTAAGALHLSAPFNIAAVAGAAGGGPASLAVLARVKVEKVPPSLLFGVPLMLAPAGGAAGAGAAFKVVHDGEMVDVTTASLLGTLCSSLGASSEALLAASTTDLESSAAGLFRLHYLLLPCDTGTSHRPPTLCAKRVASAEEILAPLLPGASPDQAHAAGLPPAVAEAVASQLAAVPLADRLDPLALSSRCGEVVEMLVRESQPMPKAQAPPASKRPVPAAGRTSAGAAALAAPAAELSSHVPQHAAPAAAAPPAKGRRPAAGGAARESGGRASTWQPAAGKGGLDLRRASRR